MVEVLELIFQSSGNFVGTVVLLAIVSHALNGLVTINNYYGKPKE